MRTSASLIVSGDSATSTIEEYIKSVALIFQIG